MAMTSTEMVVFFGEQADGTREGMDAAKASSNYYLATFNCRDAFACRLMQGLITWRSEADPSFFFQSAVNGLVEDWETLQSIDGHAATLTDTPAERAGFLSRLIDQHELPLSFRTDSLESDRLLDAVLSKWLFGTWDDLLWERGIGQLHQCGSDLAVDTYCLYKQIVEASPAELPTLMNKGEALFCKRQSNSFFAGGDQTEGGGDDNGFAIDYRLASLAKHLGYQGDGTHIWRW